MIGDQLLRRALSGAAFLFLHVRHCILELHPASFFRLFFLPCALPFPLQFRNIWHSFAPYRRNPRVILPAAGPFLRKPMPTRLATVPTRCRQAQVPTVRGIGPRDTPVIPRKRSANCVWPKPLIYWLGREDSNLRMAESKSAALPLGYAPMRRRIAAGRLRVVGRRNIATPPPLINVAAKGRPKLVNRPIRDVSNQRTATASSASWRA